MSRVLIPDGFVESGQQKGFGDHIGPFYENLSSAPVIRAVSILPHHLNPESVVHGGLLLSFLDYIIYRAIGDELGHDEKFATINLNSNFVSAAKEGDWVMGKGEITRITRSVIFAQGEIYTEDRVIMTGSGIWKRIGR